MEREKERQKTEPKIKNSAVIISQIKERIIIHLSESSLDNLENEMSL